jgi:hypothetical protein
MLTEVPPAVVPDEVPRLVTVAAAAAVYVNRPALAAADVPP